jgi:adenylyl- and sulfurtransferase ThiI
LAVFKNDKRRRERKGKSCGEDSLALKQYVTGAVLKYLNEIKVDVRDWQDFRQNIADPGLSGTQKGSI